MAIHQLFDNEICSNFLNEAGEEGWGKVLGEWDDDVR